jgi:hypothetical protein
MGERAPASDKKINLVRIKIKMLKFEFKLELYLYRREAPP